MQPLGIISGTVLPHGGELFGNLQKTLIETEYGPAVVLHSESVVFVPRHGMDPERHILPHQINHQANMRVLADLGVKEIIAVNSAGSLRKKWKPGTIMIPDDFIMMEGIPSIHSTQSAHLTPGLDPGIRLGLAKAARETQIPAVDHGVYWQMPGPRLETRAEIRMISRFADLVGMTLAGEAVTAQEFGLAYGALCSIDNYGNGLAGIPLTVEQIIGHARKNAQAMIAITMRYLENYRSGKA